MNYFTTNIVNIDLLLDESIKTKEYWIIKSIVQSLIMQRLTYAGKYLYIDSLLQKAREYGVYIEITTILKNL